jgi:hypothetical protein
MTEEVWISPNYTVQDWRVLDFSGEEDWQKAVAIFEDRIRGRFLNMIDHIQCELFAGFAVMALDCLLIETLQQFYEGVHETCGPPGNYFKRFLTQTAFRKYFDGKMAKCFYTHIRCGILHQAEIKGSSRIRIDTPDLVRWADDRRGLVINRKMFHRKLVEIFENYVAQLRDPTNQGLREKFKNKMDAICEEAS